MTVDKSLEIIQTIITQTLAEHDQETATTSTDTETNTTTTTRIAHPLDLVDSSDILFKLDMSLKEVALKAIPISLIETTGSTASELRRVSTDYFVRVPSSPILGEELDIDAGLAYAIVFKTLDSLWRGFTDYDQKADSIVGTYIRAYKKYLVELEAGTVGTGAETYIRFSADGEVWHTSFTMGDIYISFKRIDTNTWTTAARFMGVGVNGTDGTDGSNFDDALDYTGSAGKIVAVNATEDGIEFVTATSGGASSFAGLSDTPNVLTPNKFLKVNTAGTALELVDEPTSSGGSLAGSNVFGDKIFFDNTSFGTLTLDASTNNIFYLYPSSDLVIDFTQFDDGGLVSALWGTTYTFMLVSIDGTTITFNANETILGDPTIGLGSLSTDTSLTMTILKMIYTGYEWYVVSKEIVTDANG